MTKLYKPERISLLNNPTIKEAWIQDQIANDPSILGRSSLCDSSGCPGYAFVGNKSGLFMELVFKEEQGRVTDIYDCSEFNAYSPPRKFDKRVKIDRLEFPFYPITFIRSSHMVLYLVLSRKAYELIN